MIGQALTLLFLVLIMVGTGMDLLWALPLLLVPLSTLVKARWLGMMGLFLFCTLALGSMGDVDLTDLPRFAAIATALMLPTLMLLELVLTPRPYRVEKVAVWPMVIGAGLTAALAISVLALLRMRNLGIYIGSDPTLQVFVIMSLTILFTGPFLLRTGQRGASEQGQSGPEERERSGSQQKRISK